MIIPITIADFVNQKAGYWPAAADPPSVSFTILLQLFLHNKNKDAKTTLASGQCGRTTYRLPDGKPVARLEISRFALPGQLGNFGKIIFRAVVGSGAALASQLHRGDILVQFFRNFWN